ncbi:MAG: NUDIX hydrolase [Candidatus Melainabacteria bacterium]|nr:NUDIX hydrolase [Candidatus Melainabacteria bacterium]
MRHIYLERIKRLQAIAQAGLTYTPNPFDRERFEELATLSHQLMADLVGLSQARIEDFYLEEKGYPTPKVDVRGVVLQDDRFLMVREVFDGCWSLPGGWADVGLSPAENVVKEILEETGFEAEPVRFLGVLDHSLHPHPLTPCHIYRLFIECRLTGGSARTSVESTAVDFFSLDQLPPLSVNRITEPQLQRLYQQLQQVHAPAFFE